MFVSEIFDTGEDTSHHGGSSLIQELIGETLKVALHIVQELGVVDCKSRKGNQRQNLLTLAQHDLVKVSRSRKYRPTIALLHELVSQVRVYRGIRVRADIDAVVETNGSVHVLDRTL